MFFPLALFAVGVLRPLVATTVLTVDLVNAASTLIRTTGLLHGARSPIGAPIA